MRARLGRAVLSLGGSVALASAAFLAASAAAAMPAKFTRLTVDQGLSQDNVQAVLQDHLGFLWIGTEEGLNRYDGYAFVVFKHDPANPQSLLDDRVTVLHEDRDHRLWVGTERGLTVFDRKTETFAPVPQVRERVQGIVEGPDGRLWVGTEGEGLFERNPATGAYYLHQHYQEPQPQSATSLGSYVVSALLRDRAGRIWVGTRDKGVDRLAEDGKQFIHYRHDPGNPQSLAHDEVWGLAEDRAGHIWVATYGGGLSVLDPATGTFRNLRHREGDPTSLPTNLLTSVLVDHTGTAWVGTDGGGVCAYDAAADRFVAFGHAKGDPASLSGDVVRSLYEDRQGQLWIGTYLAGANLLKRPRHDFGYFTHVPGDDRSLSDPGVAAFLEDADGRIWVGTEKGWLNRRDPATGAFLKLRVPSAAPGGSAVLALHQDRRGRMWVGTYRSGLFRFDPARGTFAPFTHRAGDLKTISNDEVWAIAEDRDGALWLGTNGGLDRFDPETQTVTDHYETPSAEGSGDAGVRALRIDGQGNLWVGTMGGLNLRLSKGGGFVRYRHDRNNPLSLPHDGVVALHEGGQGRIWVGTYGGGIGVLDSVKGTFTNYKQFPSNVVYQIQEDAAGSLWVSTNLGLSRFEPGTRRVESFDATNGLQSLQFHMGAGLRTRQGRLLFGSVDGFYDFDPATIQPDTFAPPVVFTTLRILNEPVKLPTALSSLEAITLRHLDKIFSLEFAALDYTLPRRNQYAYQMEGFRDQWVNLGHKREVTFTNLDPGTYVLRVKATNSDGVWTPSSVAALRVVVRPPWWGAPWFRAAAAASLALAFVAAYRKRVRRLTARIVDAQGDQRAVIEAGHRYRSLFENASVGMFQSTPDGRFLTLNAALARLMGYGSPEEVLAEVTDIEQQFFVQPGRRQELQRLLEENGVVQDFKWQLRRRDGRPLWVKESARAVRDGTGQLLYYEGTVEPGSEPGGA